MQRLKVATAATLTWMTGLLLLAGTAASAAEPPSSFAVCLGCHTASAGAPSLTGPNLYGVVGRTAGSLGKFGYSAAMSASGIVWTREELDRFLTAPSSHVPGTTMTFGGIDDPAERRVIIDYLQSAG